MRTRARAEALRSLPQNPGLPREVPYELNEGKELSLVPGLENATGTGQAHVFFPRPEKGWS
jgi:hypothetical protein